MNKIFHGADKLDKTHFGNVLVGVGMVDGEVCAIISSTGKNHDPIYRVGETELYDTALNGQKKLKNSPVPMSDDLLRRGLEVLILNERARKAAQGFKEAIGHELKTPPVNLNKLPRISDFDCAENDPMFELAK